MSDEGFWQSAAKEVLRGTVSLEVVEMLAKCSDQQLKAKMVAQKGKIKGLDSDPLQEMKDWLDSELTLPKEITQ